MFEVWARESSCVRFFAYEGKQKYLRISFVGGGTYDYFLVDREYKLFLAAESVGKAYRELIKGRFPSRKLSQEEEERWLKAVVRGFEARRLQREIKRKEAELVALRERLAKFCR